MKTRIGNRLLIAREDRKLNQAEMAELLGVSASTYSRLERNETCIDAEQMIKFSENCKFLSKNFYPKLCQLTTIIIKMDTLDC